MKLTEEELTFIYNNIRKIEEEYMPVEEHIEQVWDVLVRLWRLPETERRLMILYNEIGSYRKLGELLGVSRQTVCNQINKIREKLK